MKERIFITGDKHGTFLPLFGLAEKMQLSSKDILIIAGDAGYIWEENYMDTIETLQQVFAGIIAFIDGNHENHAILNRTDVTQWNGGKVHQMGERVYHLMRGEIYHIYGNNIFTFGGARSVDKDRRTEGVSWWKEEEPTQKQIEYAQKQLLTHSHKIDYVISHETPLFARKFIAREKPIDSNYFLPVVLESWYHILCDIPNFKKWYFGHMHTDQSITEKLRALHHHVLPLGEEKPIPWT